MKKLIVFLLFNLTINSKIIFEVKQNQQFITCSAYENDKVNQEFLVSKKLEVQIGRWAKRIKFEFFYEDNKIVKGTKLLLYTSSMKDNHKYLLTFTKNPLKVTCKDLGLIE